MVKFISYTGKWPSLCMGTLTIEVDGKEYVFNKHDRNWDGPPSFWESGGCIYIADEEYCTSTGDWVFDRKELPEELQPYADEIFELFQDNVENGCCGGCI